MKQGMYAIYDNQTELFNPPVTAVTEGHAKRDVARVLRNPKSTMAWCAQNFSLYLLAYYDDCTGEISPVKPKRICEVEQIINEYERSTDER